MEKILLEILAKAADEFSEKELVALDLGIFPWFKLMQISFLFAGDNCDREDVAAWPCFDYSPLSEVTYPGIEAINEALSREWEESKDIARILRREAQVLKCASIQNALSRFSLSENFTVQVLNADDPHSPNYVFN